MLKQIIVLVLAISCVSAVSFTDCGSTAQIHNMTIQGCTAEPCDFRRGDTYIIEMSVTPRTPSNALPLTITGHPPLIPPVVVFSENACTLLVTGSCPSAPGNFKIARIFYTVANFIPAGTFRTRFLVLDDFGGTIVCGDIMTRTL